MLVYADTRAHERRQPPPWLAGGLDVIQRDHLTDASRRFWGQRHAHLIGERDDWQPLDDGWQVAQAGDLDPQELRRPLRWCRTVDVQDTQGRTWTAPVLLHAGGEPCILASYGADFSVVYSEQQHHALTVAKAMRSLLLSAQELSDGVDLAPAARATAELLSVTHCVTPLVLGTLSLIDDALILRVLSAAVSLPLDKREVT